jgi:hypothetical protein
MISSLDERTKRNLGTVLAKGRDGGDLGHRASRISLRAERPRNHIAMSAAAAVEETRLVTRAPRATVGQEIAKSEAECEPWFAPWYPPQTRIQRGFAFIQLVLEVHDRELRRVGYRWRVKNERKANRRMPLHFFSSHLERSVAAAERILTPSVFHPCPGLAIRAMRSSIRQPTSTDGSKEYRGNVRDRTSFKALIS